MWRGRGRYVLAMAAACGVATASCSSDPGGPGNGNGDFDAEVLATDALVFQQADIEISVGQTVRWRNTGAMVHTVTFDPGRAIDPDNVELPAGVTPFFSALGAGQTFTHTFDTPGVYRYICEPHELNQMRGTVTVNP